MEVSSLQVAACLFGTVHQVKMLEALQDIEITSRVVGFDTNSNDSVDDKYRKLHCNISPLPQE